ncbi:MAG: large conductance mechanosensitive channel protein MscL [Chloroflexota bacterium]
MRELWQEFQAFAIKGNLLQLAVAFILGVSFQTVVQSLVNNIFMPIIGAIFSDESLALKTWTAGGVAIGYGAFLSALINFLLIAAVLFFTVKGYNELTRREELPPDPTTKRCDYCATEIPIAASRCPNCTSDLQPVAA